MIIRADADALPAESNIIFMGDFNIRGSDEGGWIELFSAGNAQAFDSANAPFGLRPLSDWNNSLAMHNFHTQNPVSDMDDRFDVQVFSGACIDDADFEYVKGSLTVIGNNGTHNLGSGIATGNIPNNLANALIDFSDHLPVVAEYEFGVVPVNFESSFEIETIDNKTVQPAGPRSGEAGMNFFNIEGDDNGAFASFGVLDFDLSGMLGGGEVASDAGNVSLSLFQSNAGFTTNGPFSVYLASPTATQVTIDSSIQYQSGNNKLDCVPAVLSTGAEFLGTYAHFGRDNSGSTYPNNTLDQVGLNGIGLKQAILDSLNGLSNVRLILTPEQGATAATFVDSLILL